MLRKRHSTFFTQNLDHRMKSVLLLLSLFIFLTHSPAKPIDCSTIKTFKTIIKEDQFEDDQETINYTFEIFNPSQLADTFYFETGKWEAVTIEIIYQNDTSHFYSGWSKAHKTSSVLHGYVSERQLAQQLIFKKGITTINVRLLAKIEFEPKHTLDNTLYNKSYVSKRKDKTLLKSLPIFCCILILCLYNLMLFYLLKDWGFLIFTVQRLIFLISWINAYGYLQLLTPNINPITFLRLDHWFSGAVMFGYIYFIQIYLNTKKHDRLSHQILYYIRWTCALSVFISTIAIFTNLTFFDHIATAVSVKILPGILLIAIIFAIARVFKQIPKTSLFLAAGILSFSIGGILNNFATLGLLEENWFTENMIAFGAIIESILYSAGLASTVIDERKEKYIIQKKLIAQYEENETNQRKAKARLEEQVNERTSEIRENQTIIEKSLLEKELLLKEIHHRVKNNLQMVYGLLGLQIKRSKVDEVVSQLLSTQGRIKSMSLVHEMLFELEDLQNLSLKKFVDRIANNLTIAYDGEHRNITFQNKLIDIYIPIEQMIPLGIIINEVVTNSYKHAFSQTTSGHIFIKAIKTDNSVTISIGDNGTIDSNFERNYTNSKSLGTLLIQDLAMQMGAHVTIDKTTSLVYTFNIPINEQ